MVTIENPPGTPEQPIHMVFPHLHLVYWRIWKVASSSTGNAFTEWSRLEGKKDPRISHYRITIDGVQDSLTYAPHWRFVGLCRHPLDRLVSAYHSPSFAGRPSFPDYIRQVAATPDDRINQHLRSQVYRMPDKVELHRMEDLPDSWERIRDAFRRFDMEPPELTRENAWPRKPWQEWYDDELTRIAVERYAEDFQRLGYPVEIGAY